TVEKPAQAAPEAKAPAAPKRPAEEAAGKTLREGLARTNEGFVKKLGKLFGGARTVDDDLLGDLEEALFTADIGVRTSQKLVDGVHQALGKRELSDPKKVWQAMKGQITEMLQVDAQPLDLEQAKPFVVMVVGVNGAGKTTSIGKLANRYRAEGKKVLLAAGDTFRAAAVEQLEVWGKRAEVPVVRGKDGQDPSSVIFEAVKRATDEGYDVVIADTAGRLQAKKELMDELGKVHRVIGKAMPGAPHEVWLVLDATNGQNAISQAKEFTQVVEVTGLVLTKLDGTAKGGVVIGICDEMRLPVRYIGIGEKVEDLRPFQADAFAEALFAGA
ncbi:MAG: signal recognition particle-docking protein FtsY, partial [Myxococcales bacterium]|nr:signal recognition particle-docking protein FtsY [Myxococcales bacterium]